MSPRVLLLLVALATFHASVVFAGEGRIREAAKPIPNSYLVVLKDVPKSQVKAHARQLAQLANGRVSAVLTEAITAFGFRGSEAAAQALARNPHVAWVEEDGYLELASCPDPAATSYQYDNYSSDDHWALDRVDQRWPIGSSKTFAYTYTGAGVRAYVVDTGVRGLHQEFGGRVTAGGSMVQDPEISDYPEPGYNEEPQIPLDYSAAATAEIIHFPSVLSVRTTLEQIMELLSAFMPPPSTFVPPLG